MNFHETPPTLDCRGNQFLTSPWKTPSLFYKEIYAIASSLGLIFSKEARANAQIRGRSDNFRKPCTSSVADSQFTKHTLHSWGNLQNASRTVNAARIVWITVETEDTSPCISHQNLILWNQSYNLRDITLYMLSFIANVSQNLADDSLKDSEKKVRPLEFCFGQSSTGCFKLNTREEDWSDIDQYSCKHSTHAFSYLKFSMNLKELNQYSR